MNSIRHWLGPRRVEDHADQEVNDTQPTCARMLARISLVALPTSSFAQTKIVVSPYEGPPVIRVGEGGTRIDNSLT